MSAKAIATQMKVTCRPSVLGQALQVVSRAISSRTTLPILNNILIETTPEGLALSATNLEIGIRKLRRVCSPISWAHFRTRSSK